MPNRGKPLPPHFARTSCPAPSSIRAAGLKCVSRGQPLFYYLAPYAPHNESLGASNARKESPFTLTGLRF